jgi:uncharacterized integral membrane protein
MLSRIRWFLIIAILLLLAVFTLANTGSVRVRMPLFFSAEIPLAMLIALSTLLGFMLGALWTAWTLRRGRAQSESRAESRETTSSRDRRLGQKSATDAGSEPMADR